MAKFEMKAHWERGRALIQYFAIPAVHCADGFWMSVQATEGHYCEPRITSREAPCPYTKWEVLARDRDPMLEPFFGWEDDDGACFYKFVPTEVIEAIVEKHGGDVTDWEKIEAEETKAKTVTLREPQVFARLEGNAEYREFGAVDRFQVGAESTPDDDGRA